MVGSDGLDHATGSVDRGKCQFGDHVADRMRGHVEERDAVRRRGQFDLVFRKSASVSVVCDVDLIIINCVVGF